MKKRIESDFVAGIFCAARLFLEPHVPLERQGYVRLVKSIFGARKSALFSPVEVERKYVEGIEAQGTPASIDDARQRLAAIALEGLLDNSMPAWPPQAFYAVDEILKTLIGRENAVVKLRFGIPDGQPLTIAAIAEKFCVSPQRVKQIAGKAMRRLRHPTRSRSIHVLTCTSGEILSDYLEHLAEDAKVARKLTAQMFDFPSDLDPWRIPLAEALRKSVDDLELSVRTYNCLKNANVHTVGELAIKTEAEMLRVGKFGRKSLNELKEILGEMGLKFGMPADKIQETMGSAGS